MHNPLHISIPEPCHENWQNMTPNEQGRHCMSCQKTVVDFSLMNDREVLNYLSTAGSRVCGRFDNHQLDKTYEEPKVRRSFSWRYAWNMLIATFLVSASANTVEAKRPTQGEVVMTKKSARKAVSTIPGNTAIVIPETKIFGIVIDSSTGRPVSFAAIRIKGKMNGADADSTGKFQLNNVENGKIVLVISAFDYVTREYEIDASIPGSMITISLTALREELKPMGIVAPRMGKIMIKSKPGKKQR